MSFFLFLVAIKFFLVCKTRRTDMWRPLPLPHSPKDFTLGFMVLDIPPCASRSYCYINQSKCCCIIQGTKEKWTMFAFPSLYFTQRTDLERALLLTIKLIHLILVYWKKNHLTEKISLLLMKANMCPRDPLLHGKRVEDACTEGSYLVTGGIAFVFSP